MGIYIYTLRATTRNLTLQDGTKAKANMLAYAGKESFSQPNMNDRVINRAKNFWKNRDTLDYYFVGDYPRVGGEVYRGWPTGKAWCYDTPEFPGQHIGYLKKEGRS